MVFWDACSVLVESPPMEPMMMVPLQLWMDALVLKAE